MLLITNVKLEKSERIASNSKVGFQTVVFSGLAGHTRPGYHLSLVRTTPDTNDQHAKKSELYWSMLSACSVDMWMWMMSPIWISCMNAVHGSEWSDLIGQHALGCCVGLVLNATVLRPQQLRKAQSSTTYISCPGGCETPKGNPILDLQDQQNCSNE